MRTFVDLAKRDEHHERWWNRMAQARLFVNSVKREAVVDSILRQLEVLSRTSLNPDDGDGLEGILEAELGNVGLSKINGSAGPSFDEVGRVLLTEALQRFLIEAAPALERLRFVARIERHLGDAEIASAIANGPAATDWVAFLETLQFELRTLDNDEYQASDELTRWARERKSPVPTWRRGSHPRGLEEQALVSEILRAVSIDKWLGFLERLALPVTFDSLLWNTRVERSPALLLDWIRRAPRAFDEDGQRTDGITVYALVFRAQEILEQDLTPLNAREDGEREDGEKTLESQRPLWNALADAILSRSDGRPLLMELAAHYLVRAQAHPADSIRTQLRHQLYCALGATFAVQLGESSVVLTFARERASKVPQRSHFGLWLAAAGRCVPDDVPAEPVANGTEAVLECWQWLRQLLATKDAAIAERHSQFAVWTEVLGARVLMADESPAKVFKEAWHSLASQRLERKEHRLAVDRWRPSRFLIRIGFIAAHLAHPDRGDIAVQLWQTSQQMALSVWLDQSKSEAFDEVVYGLAHLAGSRMNIPNEPGSTYSYLLGEIDEVVASTIILLRNGAEPAQLLADARQVGIDLDAYLGLSRDDRVKEGVAEAQRAFAAIRSSSDQSS